MKFWWEVLKDREDARDTGLWSKKGERKCKYKTTGECRIF